MPTNKRLNETTMPQQSTNKTITMETLGNTTPKAPVEKKRHLKKAFWLVIMLGLVSLAVFQYVHIRALQNKVKDLETGNTAKSQAEVSDLVKTISQFMLLPTDEQPSLASVTDVSKLKDQPFFANAQVGDKVLIYSGAKKAILYRPSEQKVIEVAPLTINEPTKTTNTTTSTTKK